jgi:hypothetical protein
MIGGQDSINSREEGTFMKNCMFVCGILILCLCSLGQGANKVYISNSCGDTIVAGCPFTINIAIENDQQWANFSLYFKLSSPDGVTWSWHNMGPKGYGYHKAVTVVPGCRMIPVQSVWDFGFLVSEYKMTGMGTDTVAFGGVANNGGLIPGAKQEMIQLHMVANAASAGEGMLCLDSGFTTQSQMDLGPYPYDWVFNRSEVQAGTPIEVDWQTGGICWPVRDIRNSNPVIAAEGQIDAFHCAPGSINLTAADPEFDVINWTGEQLSGQGTFSLAAATGTANILTYTPAPDEISGTASFIVQVGDAFHPNGRYSCGQGQDKIMVVFHSIGDANNDNAINVGDAVYLINHIFKGGPAPTAWKAGDANCDGLVNVGDAVRLINHVFKGAPSPVNACCL